MLKNINSLNIKKIIILILSSFILLFGLIKINYALESCDFKNDNSIVDSLTTCIDETKFGGVIPDSNLDLTNGTGFSNLITKWVKNISSVLFVFAVGALIYAAYLLVLSGGEDEKIKKGKNIIKWTLIGFIGLISAGLIIILVVKLGYFLGEGK